MTFKFFSDDGLTVPFTGVGPIPFAQSAGGAPSQVRVKFGSAAAGKRLQAASDPGTDPVQVSVIDDDDGTGLDTTAVRLALSAGGLASATPGAPLTIGTTILSGAENAVDVYISVDAGAVTPATFTDLKLRVAGVIESDV